MSRSFQKELLVERQRESFAARHPGQFVRHIMVWLRLFYET